MGGWWLSALRPQLRKILHQVAVDEDVAAADLAEEDALSGVVKEGDEAVGSAMTPLAAP